MIKATYQDHMGDDLTVVNAARVSFDKESTHFSSQDERLIHYLARHKHTSPFGHCFASFRVDAPIFVARQLVKHKFLRWNEVSKRYVDDDPVYFYPDYWRERAEDKKQGSAGAMDYLPKWVDELYIHSRNTYYKLLEDGVAPEQARMVLPQSAMTSWWWSGSLDAWADMCKLRLGPDSQAETREVAIQIAEQMFDLFPVSWKALLTGE